MEALKNVLYRIAGEERGPLQRNGIGEGASDAGPVVPHLSHLTLFDGPLSSPASGGRRRVALSRNTS
jgi:hypothetical protein